MSSFSSGFSSGRKRRVLRRVRRRIDQWVQAHEPDATWISDTRLEFSSGAVLDLHNMLHLIETLPAEAEQDVVDHYLEGFQQSHDLMQRLSTTGEFTPEDVINNAVKVIVPTDKLGEIPTTRIDDDLSWTWGLDFDGVLVMQPGEGLADVVGHERLEAAVEDNIKQHARQCEMTDLGGALFVSGPSKVVPSVALYLLKCARILGLPPCADGYFLGFPSRTEMVIVQGDRRDLLPAMLGFNVDIFAQASQRMSPWLYHTDGDGVIMNLKEIPELAHDEVWLGPWAS